MDMKKLSIILAVPLLILFLLHWCFVCAAHRLFGTQEPRL